MSIEPQLVVPPDMELFVCGWLREALTGRGWNVEVGNREPPDSKYPLARPLVVVRDDGGPQTEAVTFDRSISVSVLGGTRGDSYETMRLAREAYALLASDRIALAEGSPIAAVDRASGTNGPYRVVEDPDTTAAYMSLTYRIVGQIAD